MWRNGLSTLTFLRTSCIFSCRTYLSCRKLRNRLAQRAFRRRQADNLRELRDRAVSSSEPQDETIRKLREENGRLRKSLIDVHAKLARLTANMQSLSENVSGSIEGSKSERIDPIPDDESLDLNQMLGEFECGALEDDLAVNTESSQSPQEKTLSLRSSPTRSPAGNIYLDISEAQPGLCATPPGLESMSQRVSSLAQEIPSIWSFEYQMGTDPYTRALSSSESTRIGLGREWTDTNSPFSDHIQSLRMTLKGKVDINRPSTGPAMLL